LQKTPRNFVREVKSQGIGKHFRPTRGLLKKNATSVSKAMQDQGHAEGGGGYGVKRKYVGVLNMGSHDPGGVSKEGPESKG